MSRQTVIQYDPNGKGYSPRGAALELWRCKASEVMIAGGAETGKTMGALNRLHTFLSNHAKSSGVLCRKVRDTIYSTVLRTYLQKVLPEGHNVKTYGGERPSWFDYPNDSRLWLAGLDDPGKVLSSEHDIIYVNQAEELTLADWETLSTRTTGRAGHAPYAQLIGDCNPGPAHHWIKQRVAVGRLKLLESRHEDNPILYTADGKLTDQGKQTMQTLDALTGVRKERLRYGRWVSAEGAVYEFDARLHLIDQFPIPAHWPRFRSLDFGFTNPLCCLWGALDPDGRIYIYRELYMTGRTVAKHAVTIQDRSAGEKYIATVADHDAEDRATLAELGIHTLPAMKAISTGIQAIETRLARTGDGKPRLFVLRNCLIERDETLAAAHKPVCLTEEFDSYAWPKGQDGRSMKETPVDKDNHACLVGGTMVSTDCELVPIEQVRSGNKVLTRQGYRQVLAAGMTNARAVVLTILLSDGRTITGTGSHPVYVVGRGFVRMDALRYNDIIFATEKVSWSTSNGSGSTAKSFAAIRMQNSGQTGCISSLTCTHALKVLADSMKRYGRHTTGRFLKTMKSTIPTAIRSITTSQTWSVLLPKNTPCGMRTGHRSERRRGLRILPLFALSPWRGISLKKGENGTAGMQKKRLPIANLSSGLASVVRRATAFVSGSAPTAFVPTNAEQPLEEIQGSIISIVFAQSVTRRFVATSTLLSKPALVHVVSVCAEKGLHPVFNLQIDGPPEFFANGILVHNCDALRYMVAYVDQIERVSGSRPSAGQAHPPPPDVFGRESGRRPEVRPTSKIGHSGKKAPRIPSDVFGREPGM